MPSNDSLQRLALTIESRKIANGGDPGKSYVARLLNQGPDAILKKIGEEATEAVMAAKDFDCGLRHGDLTEEAKADLKRKLTGEVADLWFHSLIALAYFDLSPQDVMTELERREGTSGIEEKALRKAQDSSNAGPA